MTDGAVEADYLAKLRDSSESCRTLGSRKPSILFLGDSHTYADWNFVKFQAAFPHARIASCGIGGLYFESVASFIRELTARDLTPKTIIYGASLRQFAPGKNKIEQTAEHAKLISEIRSRNSWLQPNLLENSEQLLTALNNVVPIFGTKSPRELQSESLEFHGPLVNAVPEQAANEKIQKTSNLSRRSWEEYLAQANVDETHYASLADATCDIVTKNKIRLIVVALPESPYLTGLYSVEQKARYQEILNRLEKCATLSVTETDLAGVIGNRHFLNRWAKKDFPYAAFTQADANSLGTYNADLLYDLDHLNLVGADILTSKFIGILESRNLRESIDRAF